MVQNLQTIALCDGLQKRSIVSDKEYLVGLPSLRKVELTRCRYMKGKGLVECTHAEMLHQIRRNGRWNYLKWAKEIVASLRYVDAELRFEMVLCDKEDNIDMVSKECFRKVRDKIQ